MIGNQATRERDFGWAIRDGRAVHISEVYRGLKCGCTCSECGSRLIARKGKNRKHHFAHESSDVCLNTGEIGLHKAAKDILVRRKEIVLPEVKVESGDIRPFRSFDGHEMDMDGDFSVHWNKSVDIASKHLCTFDSVEAEKSFGEFRPDLYATKNGKPMFIEMYVTHKVSEGKIDHFRKLGVSALEVDLSDVSRDISPEELESLVIGSVSNKRWLYNVRCEQEKERIFSLSTIRETRDRGLAKHVDGCPLPARIWNGLPYANAVDDCVCCKYSIAFLNGAVVCSASESMTVEDAFAERDIEGTCAKDVTFESEEGASKEEPEIVEAREVLLSPDDLQKQFEEDDKRARKARQRRQGTA